MHQSPCPVCAAADAMLAGAGDKVNVDCPNCGIFSISGSAIAELPTLVGADGRKATLVGYVLRRMHQSGQRPLLVSDDLRRILKDERLPTPATQGENLIRFLGDHSTPGQVVTISAQTHGARIGFADNAGVNLVLQGLQNEKLIQWHARTGPRQHVELTMPGWAAHRGLVVSAEPAHRLVAILATDIVGYTKLMQADEPATLKATASAKAELKAIAERNGGRLFKDTGDGTLSEFASILGAMRTALEMQSALTTQNEGKPPERHVVMRMGLAVGDVVSDGDDVRGDPVILATRMEAKAAPGTICIPDHVRDDLANKQLPLSATEYGEVELKNITRPVRVVLVAPEGASSSAAIGVVVPLSGQAGPPQFGSNPAMKARAGAAYGVAKAELDQVLMDLRLLIGEHQYEALEAVQERWVEYRKKLEDYALREYLGGTHATLALVLAGLNETKRRTEEVKAKIVEVRQR